MALSRKALMEAEFPFEEVDCPELKGTVRARALSAAEMNRLFRETPDGAVTAPPPGDESDISQFPLLVRIFVLGTEDDDGQPLFSRTLEDHRAAANLPAKAIQRVAHAIRRLSGMDDDLEQEKKDSGQTPDAAS